MGFKILFSLAVACLVFRDVSSSSVVACYHGTWSAYRSGDGNFGVGNIDPSLCTHLVYTFVGINPTDGSVIILDENLEINRGNLAAFVALKTQNPNLKTLIAVGGWNQGSINYSNMAADTTKRATFITSALALVKTYGFDGFDLDWEYPAQRGGATVDKVNFVTLIKEFREAFDAYATQTGKSLLLTAAVSASESSVDLSYDVPQLSIYLDYIFVMAYDLFGSWDGVTGQNAPLYASSLSSASSTLNVATCIQGWLSRGAAPEKLVLGLPIYGRTFTLADASNNGLGATTTGAGTAGPYTQEAGVIGYNEICEYQLAGGWTEVWDDEQKVPYLYNGNQWVSFDNPASIAHKVAFAKSLNLTGVMTWSIETDDFLGKCGTKFAILKAINTAVGTTESSDSENEVADEEETDAASDSDADDSENETSDETNDSADETEDTEDAADETEDTEDTADETGDTEDAADETKDTEDEDTSENKESTVTCTGSSLLADPTDCSKFYQCISAGDGTYKAVSMTCNTGLYFDETSQVCNWASLVSCSTS